MRVLTITNMYPSADRPSFGAFVESQVESLIAIGHSVEVLFIDGSRTALNYVDGFLAVARAIGRFSPDIVHAHYGLTGFVAAYPNCSRPLVLSLCGDDVLGTPKPGGGLTLRSRLGQHLSRLACNRADAVIVKSDEMRTVVNSWGLLDVTTIPNGVNVDYFRPPSTTERRAARTRLAMAPGHLHVLFPHTPYELRKRVDLARQVVSILGPEAALHVVFHQPRDVLRDYYFACDVMVLTSEWEGSPNVVKEAMACNLPTVSFDVGDVRWVTSGTSSHRVVPRNDVQAMVDEIRCLERIGVRDGSERIRSELSASAIAQKISGIYDRVATTPRAA